MKLIIQIPCLNEEKTLPLVLESIPKKIKGVDEIEVLIINDGSTDKTVEVAKKYGVKHFVNHTKRMGLARTFRDGIDKCLQLGADIVVNTDGDNQYPQEKIPELIQPILDGTADIVIADRQTKLIEHFSPAKKILQRFGSRVVNYAAGTDIPDAVSGFRAHSRAALKRINIVTSFSYPIETIVQAGHKGLSITSIPIRTNPPLRESRLFKNMFQHIFKSGFAIIRTYIMYKPYAVFVTGGTVFLIAGLTPFIRYIVLRARHSTNNHVQELIVGTILIIIALFSYALAIIADLIRSNRVLIEESLEQVKEIRYK